MSLLDNDFEPQFSDITDFFDVRVTLPGFRTEDLEDFTGMNLMTSEELDEIRWDSEQKVHRRILTNWVYKKLMQLPLSGPLDTTNWQDGVHKYFSPIFYELWEARKPHQRYAATINYMHVEGSTDYKPYIAQISIEARFKHNKKKKLNMFFYPRYKNISDWVLKV